MPAWLAEAIAAISAWPVAAFLRESTVAYAALNAAHIFAIGLVIGSIATLDLRVLGFFRQAPLGVIAGPLTRVGAAGMTLAAATGFLLFSVRPAAYAANPAFLAKVLLVALGVLNAFALRVNRHWPPPGGGARPHLSVRIAALFSLLIWAAAVLAGRWIGFLQ